MRLREQLLATGLFDDAPGAHHADALGELRHDTQIMCDQYQGRAGAGTQFLEQVQDLRLHGDVERGAGLVRQQDLRFGDQRHGDHHALAHAAGQLVRILAHTSRAVRDVHRLQHLDGTLFGGARAGAAMHAQHLGDLIAHPQIRIERRHRVLKHHADAIAAHLVQGSARRGRAAPAPIADAAAKLGARRRQPQYRQQQLGLAGTRFAHDARGIRRRRRRYRLSRTASMRP